MNKFLFLILISSLSFASTPMSGYDVSNIQSFDKLSKIFNSLNKRSKNRSECFHRAHYWSFQMFKEYGVYSTKTFVFFTNKYKKEINGQWWFHVAPGLRLNDKEFMLDPEFLYRPVPLKAWINGVLDHAILKLTPIKISYENRIDKIDNLLLNTQISESKRSFLIKEKMHLISELKRRLIWSNDLIQINSSNWAGAKTSFDKMVDLKCTQVENYSDINEYDENTYCYSIRSSMYYMAPRDLSRLEKEGREINSFLSNDVRRAFKKAFRGRLIFRLD